MLIQDSRIVHTATLWEEDEDEDEDVEDQRERGVGGAHPSGSSRPVLFYSIFLGLLVI